MVIAERHLSLPQHVFYGTLGTLGTIYSEYSLDSVCVHIALPICDA